MKLLCITRNQKLNTSPSIYPDLIDKLTNQIKFRLLKNTLKHKKMCNFRPLDYAGNVNKRNTETLSFFIQK